MHTCALMPTDQVAQAFQALTDGSGLVTLFGDAANDVYRASETLITDVRTKLT